MNILSLFNGCSMLIIADLLRGLVEPVVEIQPSLFLRHVIFAKCK